MFPKPAFGGTTSFGSFSSNTATASPFSGFKPTTGTSTFGAPPAFGANTATQPATGGGLFGSTNTSAGLFGASPAATPGFGATTSLFGAPSTSAGGLFSTNASGGMFPQQNASSFNAKPGGFGFGNTTTAATTGGGLFGATPTTGAGGLFGQQNNTLGGGGLFNTSGGGFGQQQQQQNGTAVVKYNPVVGTDVVVKSGTQQNVSIKHHCITCMKEYEGKSLEELRLEDYTVGRKGGGSAGGMFSSFTAQPEAKPLFGSTFGQQPTTTTATSVFGGGGLPSTGFGAQSAFSFGQTAQPNTSTTGGFFGAAKPTFGATPAPGSNLFGATTTQAPTFGTTTPSFGFGANNQNQSGGLFAQKPATSFGAAPASSFGSFGAGGGLFAKPQQTTAPAFSTAAPAFGSTPGFGANTGTTGLFGNNSFNKPATTQPAFGFPTTSTGMGGGMSLGNSFGQKPGVPNFGAGGGTSLFNTPAQNTFTGGLGTSLGGGGGGIFGNTSLGGPSLGMSGLGNNTGFAVNNNLSGASAAGNVHEQILTLVARPYGDSPLFKDLQPDTSKTCEDVLKPTNPAAVKAVLDKSMSGEFRVSAPHIRLKLHPLPVTLKQDKKSLFDGLEESDASLEDKLTLKPSRKRLVLRPKSQLEDSHNDSVELTNQNRSLEDTSKKDTSGVEKEKENDISSKNDSQNAEKQAKNNSSVTENNNIEYHNIRNASWLNASRRQSNENEKPIDGEPTPRLYPILDKELPMPISERRASWLTTKPLRKAQVSETDSAENTVRDLNVRTERLSHEKYSVDILSVSEEEMVAPREMPPHPTGVKLTRPGYYTIPSLDEMIKYMRPDGSCVVPHLTIGRKNYGNVYYDCEIDVAGLDLDSLVHFLNKEVTIYPDDSDKPPVGEGLNRRAIVTLDRIWPRDKTEKRPITDPQRLIAMDYEGKLRRVCDKHDTKFIEYRPQTGSWVFRVEHFSKYSLTDSDDEDEITPDVIKRQLVTQQLQKTAPLAPPQPATVQAGLSFTGLGGLSHTPQPDNMYMLQQTSLNLLSSAGRVFDMDTTEDNTESQSLYQDSQRAYGVKSPTSELAKLENRQSHNVQLMKASLYADTDMEDDMSVSTGDQMVPRGATVPHALRVSELAPAEASGDQGPELQDPVYEEVQMKPLIVRPHTVVLKYHRKIPPFKKTIAGRVNASSLADMSICRARHTRIGFGPSGNMAFATTYNSVNKLSKKTELCDIGKYVRGRLEDDWSEPIVVRMAIGHTEEKDNMQAILIKQLDTLLDMSTLSECDAEKCPKLTLKSEPSARRETLNRLLKDCQPVDKKTQFGVTTAYYYEVLKLCEALWGADLDNDGIPGTDDQSIVNRHRKFLEWLTDAVAGETDRELAKPTKGEEEDEMDGHSARIWTLMVGGRVVEACKVSAEHGDLNMAALIAQAAGDPYVRSLISRQLSSWAETGASQSISGGRLSALRLISGVASARDLQDVDWLRALHATARYLCPQVPTLEHIITKYESFFDVKEDMDLSVVKENSGLGMNHPLPDYVDEYSVSVTNNGKERRILDLRYELIRARAFNTRPKLQPASYTPDPLDYSISFMLGVWLGSPAAGAAAWAARLEAGHWWRAVHVLLYHPDDNVRGHLIRDVLSRHAPAVATPEIQKELDLIIKLGVPEKWINMARAHRAKYEHQPLLEAEYLVAAEEWNAAHQVLIEELMPQAVLSDDMKSIKSLVEKLHAAAQRHQVSGWENGGQALYYFLQVEESESPSRSVLYAAQSALQRLSAKPSPLMCCAKAELSSRLAAHGANTDIGIVRATQIATDLAEQASELSIESTPSSPLQRNQATAVVS